MGGSRGISGWERVLDAVAVHIVIVFFVATLVRSAFGFGEALVAVPLLALRVPVAVAVPLAVLLSILVAGVVVAQDWREIHLRSAAWLVGATVLGIPVGLWLLKEVDDRVVKGILAGVILAFSTYSLMTRRPPFLERDRRAWMFGAGFAAGVLGGAYGMNGPPLVVYGAMRRWSAQHFRATLQAYFLPASLIGVVGYWGTGLIGREVGRYFVMCLPGALVAIVLGRMINRRLNGRGFLKYVHIGLILIAVRLLVQVAWKG